MTFVVIVTFVEFMTFEALTSNNDGNDNNNNSIIFASTTTYYDCGVEHPSFLAMLKILIKVHWYN